MVNLSINGKNISVPEKITILEAAASAGIEIPTLCYLKGVNAIGSCRLCMVEIEGYSGLLAACKTIVREDMVVTTESEKITAYRREMLKLILSNHTVDCMNCPDNGICRLQKLCNEYDIKEAGYLGSRAEIENKLPKINDNPYIAYDPGKCIHCQRCVSECNRKTVNETLKNGRTGTFHIVEAPFGKDWKTSGCESCGICAEVCPTGALTL